MSETIGFIGLGGMGSAMAANLLKAGFPLKVYNRTPERPRHRRWRKRWRKAGSSSRC